MPRRTSAKQLAANRANAQKSTGPRTPRGKSRVRYNALTHGLLARAVIPPVLEAYESRDEYDRMLQAVHDELAPATPVEHLLVDSIAASYWRLARLCRAEAGLIARRRDANRREDPLPNDLPFGAPAPHPAVARLRANLDDPAALRALLAAPGSGRESYTDTQILEFAQGTIAVLEVRHEQALARWREVADVESSFPHPEIAQRLGRYEAQLNRQILRALRMLRELRSLRAAGPLPPGDAPPTGKGRPGTS